MTRNPLALSESAQHRCDRRDRTLAPPHWVALGRHGPHAVPRGANPSPTLPLTPLVGRNDEVAKLLEALVRPGIMTITGAPGVGKSRIALEVATRADSTGLGLAVVVNVSTLRSPRQLDHTLMRALDAAGEGSPAGEAGDAGVVVLDDCDRLVSACAAFAQNLADRGRRVLATSREPLRATGESSWRVGTLPVPAPGQQALPGLFTESDAVQLFCMRASAVRRGFIPTPDKARALAEICRRLDGLAIDLAANNVLAFSLDEIAGRLEAGAFSLLANGVRTGHPRHESLSTAIAWSYNLLSPFQQVLLERLAIFSGSFSLDATVQVCTPDGASAIEVLDTLRALAEKSLVEVDMARPVRYRLLSGIRWFAAEKMADRGGNETLRERHAAWCLDAVRAASSARSAREWHDRIQPYHQDIHAAVTWAVTKGAGDTAAALGQADARLCHPRGSAIKHSFGLDALTPSELRVAALVAEGLTNREIAELLCVSARTVQTHLGHIFAKVGVPTRTALAAELMRQGGVPSANRDAR
jgi:predicted ATPase/DNA-binding CsgD family transcriptional regulator